MGRKRVILWTVVLSFIGTACTDQRPDERREAMHLASGSLTEQVRIDGHDEELVPVRALVVTRDGTIVFGQPLLGQIRFYSEDGQAVGAFGGRGQGPGEFLGLYDLGLVGDSVWAFDLIQRRLTVISPSRELVEMITMPPRVTAVPDAGEVPDLLRPTPVGFRPDGSIQATFLEASGALPEALHGLRIGRVTQDGVLTEVLVRMPDGPMEPSLIQAFTAVSSSGKYLAGAYTSMEGPDEESFQVWMWDSEGTEIWSRRYPFERRSIPQAWMDSVIQAEVARLPPQARQEFQNELEVPSVFPPLAGIHVGRDGTIWVQKYSHEGESPYLVLESTGDPLGTLVLPEGSLLMEADARHIWIVEVDALEVPSVVRYAVEWNE